MVGKRAKIVEILSWTFVPKALREHIISRSPTSGLFASSQESEQIEASIYDYDRFTVNNTSFIGFHQKTEAKSLRKFLRIFLFILTQALLHMPSL